MVPSFKQSKFGAHTLNQSPLLTVRGIARKLPTLWMRLPLWKIGGRQLRKRHRSGESFPASYNPGCQFLVRKVPLELGNTAEICTLPLLKIPDSVNGADLDKDDLRISPVVQWLRLLTSTAGAMGSIPGPLVWELRSRMPRGMAKNKQTNKNKKQR